MGEGVPRRRIAIIVSVAVLAVFAWVIFYLESCREPAKEFVDWLRGVTN